MNLQDLRIANVARCEQVFHPLHAWSPSDWGNALAGEVGEACNIAKKIRRMDDNANTAKDPQTLDEARVAMAKELADTVIYADLLAARLDIDLGEAIRTKFNEVSDRMGSDIKL